MHGVRLLGVAMIGVAAFSAVVPQARAGVPSQGPRFDEFPDVIVSDLGSPVTKYGTFGGITAYAFTTVSCNIGYNDAIWIARDVYKSQHPVISESMYRVYNGRCEQIGMSWLKHGFCAADWGNCMNLVDQSQWTSTRGSLPITNPPDFSPRENVSCDWLGLFTTDTYSATLNSQQSSLGPRSEVNPWTGEFPYPYVLESNVSGTCINKRLQVTNTDLDNTVTGGFPGARYFIEAQYVVTDEWPGQRYNNVSHREVIVGPSTNQYDFTCGSGTGPTLDLANAPAYAMSPAIDAWQRIYPNVKLATVDVPDDGRLIVGSLATDNGNGTWTYEYAVYNMNCNRGVRSFSVPCGRSAQGVNTIGFHDVAYHSGEPQDGTNWPSSLNGTTLTWSTPTYQQNQHANALRWGTMYNFRFVSPNAPSTTGDTGATLGLFLSGSATDAVTVVGIDVPVSKPLCPADFDNSGTADIGDLLSYINAWLSRDAGADFNHDAVIDVLDLFSFINLWLTHCQ